MSSTRPLSFDRAESLLELGRPAEALTALATASTEQLAAPEYWILRSSAHLMLRESTAALEAADRAALIDPADSAIQTLRAYAFSQADKDAAASAAAQRAVSLDPFSADAHLCLARMLHRIEPASKAAARADRRELDAAQRAVELAPFAPNCFVALAAAHARREEWQHMRAAADRALELAPDDDGVHHDLAALNHELGAYGVAASGFARSAALDPTGVAPLNFGLAVRGLILRRVWVAFWAMWGSRLAVTVGLGSLSDEARMRIWSGVSAVLVAALLLVPVGRFVRGLDPGMRPAVLRAVRTDRRTRTFLALILTVFTCFTIAATSPSMVAHVVFLVGLIFYFVFIGLSWRWRKRTDI